MSDTPKEELRAYFFGNMYLSSIQQGIQAQHCTAEMFTKYTPVDDFPKDMLFDWAKNHKTSILLNGGYALELYRLVNLLAMDDNVYPYAWFCESKEALDGALTCVGVILPNKVYDCVIHSFTHNGKPGVLRTVSPELVLKEEYEVMLKLGYWRGGIFPEPTHYEVRMVQEARLSWWDYRMALELKKYSLAR